MYGWNAGGELSDGFGLREVGGVGEHVVCDITPTRRLGPGRLPAAEVEFPSCKARCVRLSLALPRGAL